ncbi:MAG TPA: hypothetical protein DCQ92_06535 [Verrucomicrobia subdivision 3 bacterium]|nr:hypothetical protein [Limisphaerales bacterium]
MRSKTNFDFRKEAAPDFNLSKGRGSDALWRFFKYIFAAILLVGFTRVDAQSLTNAPGQSVETIVCIRHGEIPTNQLGQLNGRGLNRALALPKVLLAKYGSPQFIFTCNPTQKLYGYYYVRPLATIEPTAIRCGLPVNTQFGFKEISGLETELQKEQYANATVFVAWEHTLLDHFVKQLVKTNGGNPQEVPDWPSGDFDTIFEVKIIRSEERQSVVFTIDHEGLNNLSDICP